MTTRRSWTREANSRVIDLNCELASNFPERLARKVENSAQGKEDGEFDPLRAHHLASIRTWRGQDSDDDQALLDPKC